MFTSWMLKGGKNGIEVDDIVRFFHGDGPAAQFEARHRHTVVGQTVGYLVT